MKPKRKARRKKVIKCGDCGQPKVRCTCKKKSPLCRGYNYHVFALGENICSLCGFDRNRHTDKKRVFRVWVNQVNQTYVDVLANSREEAKEKGYAKWRREAAHSEVNYIQEQE